MDILQSTWSRLVRWDFKSARAGKFRADHPHFKPLGEFIEDATELIYPAAEPGHLWPVYGVSNTRGIFFSHRQKGETFSSNYKKIREDYFFHNPTRANIGSIGRVPRVPADAITSPEYQVWKPRNEVDPDYLEVLVKSPLFIRLIDIHRVGGVKERLFLANLMEIPVPVLSEKQQQKLFSDIKSCRLALRVATAAFKEAEGRASEGIFDLVLPEYREAWQSPAQGDVFIDEEVGESPSEATEEVD